MAKASRTSRERGERRLHFFHETNFILNNVANRQSTRVIAFNPSDVPFVMQSKNLASVMALAAVARDVNVMPPHFIEAGLTIYTGE